MEEGQPLNLKHNFTELENVIQKGFDSLLREFRLGREQGHIPVSVMKEILDSNNIAYKEMMKSTHEMFKESSNSSNQNYRKILNTLCVMMALVMGWVTGMKVFFPDTVTNIGSKGDMAAKVIESMVGR
jgi:hypothetical protein